MTSLKKVSTPAVLLALALGALLVTPRLQAQVIPAMLSTDTTACDAYMVNKKGKWKFKAKAERRSETYLVWGKLILRFDADFYEGGPNASAGYVAIMTDSKPREIVFHEDLVLKGDKWTYETEVATPEGLVRLKCHL